MTTIKMKTENINNTVTIDRRSFLQGVAIASVGVAVVKVSGGSQGSDSQALSASAHGEVTFKLVRKPHKSHMARSKKAQSRSAQAV